MVSVFIGDFPGGVVLWKIHDKRAHERARVPGGGLGADPAELQTIGRRGEARRQGPLVRLPGGAKWPDQGQPCGGDFRPAAPGEIEDPERQR